MGVKERRAREKELLRQQILSAARELFVDEGYENVSCERLPTRSNTHRQQSTFILKTRQIFRFRLPGDTSESTEHA